MIRLCFPQLARRTATLVLAVLAAAAIAAPAAASAPPDEAAVVATDQLTWQEIVPGLDFAAVSGDWSAEAHGKFVRVAPGFASPVHRHTGDYHGVVISGVVTNPYVGEEEPPRMEAGTYWYVPAGEPHVTACVSDEACVFYTHSAGAWDLEVVEDAAQASPTAAEDGSSR